MRVGGHHPGANVDAQRRCLHQHDEGMPAVHDRAGVGWGPMEHAHDGARFA